MRTALTEEKYCREPGTYCGLILLMSTRNGEPLAFINDGILHFRNGGGAGIGVKHCRARTPTCMPARGMAKLSWSFACATSDCKVYSPTPAHREAFAEEMSRRLNIEVRAVDDPREAVSGADLLSSCTDSMAPVYDADWIEPGMHVTNPGAARCPTPARQIDLVVRQGTAGLQMKQTERLAFAAFARGLIGGTVEEMVRIPEKNPQPGFGGDNPSSWIAARAATSQFHRSRHRQGRTSRDRDVLSQRRNQGRSFVGRRMGLRQAAKQKKGRVIPTEWFLQDIRD